MPDPVDRDWDAIRKSGVIRMITRYNSTSYFIHRGVERGFDYEFIKEFARANNLALEVVIQKDGESLIDLLNSGSGDLIAAQYAFSEERDEIIDFTDPYEVVNEVVVAGAMVGPALTSVEKLAGLTFHVRKGSSSEKALEDLQAKGIAVKIERVDEEWDAEALMLAVSNGDIQATVCDENVYRVASGYIENIATGPILRPDNRIAIGVRRNSSELLTRLNAFVASHIKEEKNGRIRKSPFFAGLMKRYYEDQKQMAAFKQPLTESRWAGTLSPYDKLVQPIAQEYGLDWRLMIAIMAQESLFNPQARSWAGAVGLMQVMPKSSKFSEAELLDPERNVREAARLMSEMQSSFTYIPEPDRTAFVLAAYNAGIGHLNDARRLAIDMRKDPNTWEAVSEGFLKLMNPAYYEDARYGFCRGIETVKYVREVMNRYNMYVSVLNLAENGRSGGVYGLSVPVR